MGGLFCRLAATNFYYEERDVDGIRLYNCQPTYVHVDTVLPIQSKQINCIYSLHLMYNHNDVQCIALLKSAEA